MFGFAPNIGTVESNMHESTRTKMRIKPACTMCLPKYCGEQHVARGGMIAMAYSADSDWQQELTGSKVSINVE